MPENTDGLSAYLEPRTDPFTTATDMVFGEPHRYVQTVFADTRSGPLTVTLPEGNALGRKIDIKLVAGEGPVTVTAAGGSEVDGRGAVELSPKAQYIGVTLVSDGESWHVV